jgi:hypothetical protein
LNFVSFPGEAEGANLTALVRVVLLSILLCGSAARAQAALVPAVLDAPGVSDASVRKIQRGTESVLKQLSGLTVGEGPVFHRGAPRRCGEDCVQQLVKGVSSAALVVLDLKALDAKGERVSVELQFWLDGEKTGVRRGEGSVEGFEAAVRPVLELLLPAWARRGYGGLLVQVAPGATVKIDGRPTPTRPAEVLPLTAGVHQVDVVFADGHAVLQRLELTEGARKHLSVEPSNEAVESVSRHARTSTSALRVVSYATWMAGAAVLAGGLVAGALGKGTAGGLSPCTATTRDCATLDAVLERNRQAQAYASSGNVLLGIGGALATVGAGLFIIDLATE